LIFEHYYSFTKDFNLLSRHSKSYESKLKYEISGKHNSKYQMGYSVRFLINNIALFETIKPYRLSNSNTKKNNPTFGHLLRAAICDVGKPVKIRYKSKNKKKSFKGMSSIIKWSELTMTGVETENSAILTRRDNKIQRDFMIIGTFFLISKLNENLVKLTRDIFWNELLQNGNRTLWWLIYIHGEGQSWHLV